MYFSELVTLPSLPPLPPSSSSLLSLLLLVFVQLRQLYLALKNAQTLVGGVGEEGLGRGVDVGCGVLRGSAMRGC